MDLINKFINVVLAPFATLSLFFFLPPYFFFKYLSSTLAAIFSEDVTGKVVLITGASSGIGEHLAYEYAKRGACLALVARREYLLRQIAAAAEEIGSPHVIVIPGDVSKVEDCQTSVDATLKQFGRLDHLVANAGVSPVSMFEHIPDVTKLNRAMDVNFWGSIYSAYFAIPYLKKTKGKIIAVASCASWLPAPRMSVYCATKAAVVSLYETLRVELRGEVGVTIVNPGLINTEMTGGKFLNQQGQLIVDKEMKDVQVNVMPLESPQKCAKAIVKAACRGDKYMIEPAWYQWIYFWKAFCPDVVEWTNRFFLVAGPGRSDRDTVGKRIVDLINKVKDLLTISVESVEFRELLPFPDDGNFMHHAD